MMTPTPEQDQQFDALLAAGWDALESMPMNELLDRDDIPPPRIIKVTTSSTDEHPAKRAWWARFFAGAAGTHWPSVISSAAAARQVALGVMLLTSAGVTGLAAAAAIDQTGAGSMATAVVSGLAVAVAVFLLDRALLVAPSSGRFLVRFIPVVPRVALAALLALVVSGALSIALFRSEIDRQVADTRTAQASEYEREAFFALETHPDFSEASPGLRFMQEESQRLQERVATLTEERDVLLTQWMTEVSGAGLTGSVGAGPFAAELQSQIDQVQDQLDETVAQYQQVESELLARQAADASAEQTRYEAVDADVQLAREEILSSPAGVVERFNALKGLDSSSVVAVQALIFIVVFTLGSLPVLLRLQPPSSHDLLLLERERLAAAAVREREEIRAEMDRQLAAIELFAQQGDRLAEMDVTASQRRHLLKLLDESATRHLA